MSKGILILKSWSTASILGIVALILMCLSGEQADSIRNVIRESLVPASQVITWIEKSSSVVEPVKEDKNSHDVSDQKLAHLQEKIDSLKSQTLHLQSHNIELKKQISEYRNNGKPEYQGTHSEPLFIPNLIDARILGKELTRNTYASQILKIGSRDGISKENLVLEADDLLIDQGNKAGISTEQLVFTGRTLLGRISQTGLHTSTLQLITDPEFRSRVHIYAEDAEEQNAPGEGILTGSEKSYCLLKYVPTTQPVSVGDNIYIADTTNTLPSPIYIGKVIEASHQSDEQFWSIKVQPAMKKQHPRTVQILRIVPNPKRIASNLEP